MSFDNQPKQLNILTCDVLTVWEYNKAKLCAQRKNDVETLFKLKEGVFIDCVCVECGEDIKIRVGWHGKLNFSHPTVNTIIHHKRQDGGVCYSNLCRDVEIGNTVEEPL